MHESIAFTPIIETLEILTGSFFGGKERKCTDKEQSYMALLWEIVNGRKACRYRKLYFVLCIYIYI